MDLRDLKDYRALLTETLARRCERNPRYSQSAFARDLGLAPHRLSQVLRGKLGLSRTSAGNLARRMGLGEPEQAYFCDLVDREHARSAVRKRAAAGRIARRAAAGVGDELRLEEFQLVADWYHLAIVELTKVRGFRSDPRWIAGCLGIAEAEVRIAIDRLVRLGVLAWRDAALVVLKPDNVVTGGVPSAAVQSFHRRLIERALQALSTQPVEDREFNTSLVAIPRARLPEVRARVRSFWTDMLHDLGDSDQPPDDLYCMAIQVYHLTDRSRLSRHATPAERAPGISPEDF